MPLTVKLILALSPDKTCWIATASDGTAVRAKLLDSARSQQRKALRSKYGDATLIEEEILEPPELRNAEEELSAARQAEQEAEESLAALQRVLGVELLRNSVGQVLRKACAEIAARLNVSERRLLELVSLPSNLITDDAAASNAGKTQANSHELAALKVQAGAARDLKRKSLEKRRVRDTLRAELGVTDLEPDDLTRVFLSSDYLDN